MSIKDLTILITSFRSENAIQECLRHIDKECKVINIENSNNQEHKINIEKNFKNVECILSGENLGYAKANNIGLKNTKTKYALILNPDSRLSPDALKNFFLSVEKHPDFAMIGPNLMNFDTNKNKLFKKNNLELTKNIKGHAMFLNLSQFKDIGFFDENFFIYLEEIDLCRRLVNKGKKIYIDPNIEISHKGGKSHDPSINFEMELSRNWHWMWSQFYFQKKYNGYFYSVLQIMPKFFSTSFKIIFYSLLLKKEKLLIYYYRLKGIISGVLGQSSWYRPKIKN
tara:strand:+ start:1877 stop:2725 length:849 start_codon:yes stop_codon:yes gene_type:complete